MDVVAEPIGTYSRRGKERITQYSAPNTLELQLSNTLESQHFKWHGNLRIYQHLS